MEESFIVISFIVSEKKRWGEKRPPIPKYRKNTPCEIGLRLLLLYGDKDHSCEVNRDILRLTLRFIRETGRFD